MSYDLPANLECDNVYDSLTLNAIPRDKMQAMGAKCYHCMKRHLVLAQGNNNPDGPYVEIYVRCSEECGAFIKMRVCVA